VETVGNILQVFVDGGIRRGSDVFKALAIGAKAVGIGRAALFGLAAYGQEGAEKALEILQDELFTTMQVCARCHNQCCIL
jgi:isopentenyl diphosphate isomerase/L-lactate dehydrogenase-like FMN-dependent dehydrogenase